MASRWLQIERLSISQCNAESGTQVLLPLSVLLSLVRLSSFSFFSAIPIPYQASANLRLFLQSGTEAQYAQCRARQPMMDDIR